MDTRDVPTEPGHASRGTSGDRAAETSPNRPESEGSTRVGRHAEAIARLTDDGFRIPVVGIRVGIDPILGLIPGWGDTIGALLSGWIVIGAAWSGAPAAVVGRMLLNLAADALLGTVPLLGDVFDVGFRANRRNTELLERYLEAPRPTHRRSVALVLGVTGTVLLVAAGLAWVSVSLVRAVLRFP